jgi:hypothetical protein
MQNSNITYPPAVIHKPSPSLTTMRQIGKQAQQQKGQADPAIQFKSFDVEEGLHLLFLVLNIGNLFFLS